MDLLSGNLKIDLPRRRRASVYLSVIGTGLVLSAYIITLAEHIDHGNWSGSVARLGFIASLMLVAWTAHLALKPTGGFLEPLMKNSVGRCAPSHPILVLFLGSRICTGDDDVVRSGIRIHCD